MSGDKIGGDAAAGRSSTQYWFGVLSVWVVLSSVYGLYRQQQYQERERQDCDQHVKNARLCACVIGVLQREDRFVYHIPWVNVLARQPSVEMRQAQVRAICAANG